MKILLQNRPHLWSGGDQIQIIETAKVLNADISCKEEPDLSRYDVVILHHLAGYWTLLQYKNCIKYKKPYVLYTMFFETDSQVSREEMQEIYDNASVVVSFGDKELDRIRKYINPHREHIYIENGISDIFTFAPEKGKYVLIVARISKQKNIHKAIEVCKNLNLILRIIGYPSPMELDYYSYIRRLHSVESVDYQNMPEVYQGAQVNLSISDMELDPLNFKEGLASGCNSILAPTSITWEKYKDLANVRVLGNLEEQIKELWNLPKQKTNLKSWWEVGEEWKKVL